ncbi:hypothetical protein [Hanstruepera marina]|uniref:hypothetical protein n=1 Tax=Hanstruepera marina TaxID=2873265 RepID=UPI001CA6439C|nr:hypothetical protein [Hanstruepera marina]
MKHFFLILIAYSFISYNISLTEVREAYKAAANDKTKVEGFYNMLSEITKEDKGALVAYKGASIALQAKYAKTIKEKKEGFINGISYIEYAIKTDPNNIEPRFVRLGIQENTPKLLKYKDAIDEDKQFILKQFQYIKSKNLKEHIRDYILQSSIFSTEEKQLIKNQ